MLDKRPLLAIRRFRAMARVSTQSLAGASVLLEPGVFDQARLAWRLLRDERVGALKYVVPALVLIYVVSPIDPIPDFLLGIGQVDDLGAVVAALLVILRLTPRLAPADVVSDHLRAMGKADAGPHAAPGKRDDPTVDARYTVRG